jgi:hypothetical protein
VNVIYARILQKACDEYKRRGKTPEMAQDAAISVSLNYVWRQSSPVKTNVIREDKFAAGTDKDCSKPAVLAII